MGESYDHGTDRDQEGLEIINKADKQVKVRSRPAH